MNEQEIKLIVEQAIPLRKCAMDRANDMARRVWLMKKIKEIVSKELSKQFNAVEA